MSKETIIIGIAGASGSGKSLLANTLHAELGSEQVVVISEDSYYKDVPPAQLEQRDKINYDHPDSLDHPLFCQHLTTLKNNQAVEVPIYNHAQDARAQETRHVGPHRIIVLEGILLFVDPTVRKLLDISVYMDTPLDICLIRRLKRDIVERGRSFDSVLAQYERTVRPMYLQFIEPSKRYADIIIPRGGENRIAIDLMKAKIKEVINNDTIIS